MGNIRTPALLALLAVSFGTASVADLYKGLSAYVAGNYITAFKELKSPAEQGDVTAQNLLGGLYHTGDGVSQNYVEAAKWFGLAAEQGRLWRNPL